MSTNRKKTEQCKICGKFYINKKTLYKHTEKYHPVYQKETPPMPSPDEIGEDGEPGKDWQRVKIEKIPNIQDIDNLFFDIGGNIVKLSIDPKTLTPIDKLVERYGLNELQYSLISKEQLILMNKELYSNLLSYKNSLDDVKIMILALTHDVIKNITPVLEINKIVHHYFRALHKTVSDEEDVEDVLDDDDEEEEVKK